MFGKDELGKLFGEDFNRTGGAARSGSSSSSATGPGSFVPQKDLVKKPQRSFWAGRAPDAPPPTLPLPIGPVVPVTASLSFAGPPPALPSLVVQPPFPSAPPARPNEDDDSALERAFNERNGGAAGSRANETSQSKEREEEEDVGPRPAKRRRQIFEGEVVAVPVPPAPAPPAPAVNAEEEDVEARRRRIRERQQQQQQQAATAPVPPSAAAEATASGAAAEEDDVAARRARARAKAGRTVAEPELLLPASSSSSAPPPAAPAAPASLAQSKPAAAAAHPSTGGFALKFKGPSNAAHQAAATSSSSSLGPARDSHSHSSSGSDDDSEDDSEDDSDDDSDEEDAQASRKLFRPVFRPKEARQTIAEAEKEAEEKERQYQREQEEKARRAQEASALVSHELKREEEEAAAAAAAAEAAELKGKPDDRDPAPGSAEDDEAFEEWKLRELKRIARDAEAEREALKEQQETERRRNLTEEERRREDEELERQGLKVFRKDKLKWSFLQRYHHKGAFFMDDESEVKAKAEAVVSKAAEGAASLTGEDALWGDRSLLPKVMQVKGFGKKGRSKWTHLANEDTTNVAAFASSGGTAGAGAGAGAGAEGPGGGGGAGRRGGGDDYYRQAFAYGQQKFGNKMAGMHGGL